MKDELDELTTDASTRKTATDWLMQVISGRKPINLHLNSPAQGEDSLGAVAVAEKEPAEEPESSKWAGEFGAEDLCGTPAVPVIRVYSAAYSEVTADDVCWVPEERRLKPQPAAEAAPRVLRMAAPGIGSEREPEAKGPETRKPLTPPVDEGFFRQTSLAAEPAPSRSSLDDELTLAEISREPAPYVVEPMPIWGAFSDSFHASEVVDRPITEADISRDWVVQSTEPMEEKGKDGVVLPFSFKVLKSREAEKAAATMAAQPEASAIVPVTEEDRAGSVDLAPEVKEASVTEDAASPEMPEITEAAAELETAQAVQPESAVSVEEEMVAAVPSEPATEGIEAVEQQAAVEVKPSPVSGPEPPQVDSPEPPQAMEAEVNDGPAEAEEALPKPEVVASELAPETAEAVPEESAPGPDSAEQPESVFAREGFWKGAVPGEVAASEEPSSNEETSRNLDMDLKPSHPAPEGEDLDGAGQPPEEWVSAWKALLRIGSVLPQVAKSLPALEAGAMGDSGGAPGEVRQDVAGLRLVQYEIRTTVQDHTLHLKRMDEQLGRIRESLESRASDSDLAENVESMSRLVRIVGAGLGGLVLVLILLVAILLAHGR